jgi:hypothetical protein
VNITEEKKAVLVELDWHELPEVWKATKSYERGHSGEDWRGGSDADLARCLVDGDRSCVAEAEGMLDAILDDLDMQSFARQSVASPVGGSPVVGAYLSGNPNSMRRWVTELDSSEQGAIRLIVDRTASCGVSPAEIRAKGIAMLALTMALQSVRPVELYAAVSFEAPGPKNGTGDRYSRPNRTACMLVRIGSRPLDLSSAGFALWSPLFLRRLGFSVLQKVAEGLAILDPKATRTHGGTSLPLPRIPIAEQVKAGPGDLVFAGQALDDNRAIAKDPLAWVKAQAHKALAGSGSANETYYDRNPNYKAGH